MTEHDAYTEDVQPAERAALSPWAIVATILGILGFFGPTTALRVLIGILAIVAGVAALHDINRGLKSGRNWATGGICLGGLVLALAVLTVALSYA